MGVATNLNITSSLTIAMGASVATSNIASYFDQYQSVFTVGVSVITCAGFIMGIIWGMWIKWAAHKEIVRHNKRMERD